MELSPKEEAHELVEQFTIEVLDGTNSYSVKMSLSEAKRCAIIAVDKILGLNSKKIKVGEGKFLPCSLEDYVHWQEVRKELEKL